MNGMNDDSDESDLTAELSSLLEALVLGVATVQQRSRLDSLLAGNLALRRYASRFLEEEARLRHHFQLIGQVSDCHLPPDNWNGSVAKSQSGGVKMLASSKRVVFDFCLTASLMAIVVGGALWSLRHQVGVDRLPDDHSSPPLDLEAALSAVPAGDQLLPRVTTVSWSGPVFARHLGNPLSVEMRGGVIPYREVDGRHAEGYMVRLPPGGILSLVATANAGAENALSVIEFDGNAQPTGRRMSFSNRTFEPLAVADAGDGLSSSNLTLGPIGVMSEENTSGEPRYFFLTSVHKLERFPEHPWHVSRMALMLRGDQCVHLGWDDSGSILEGDAVKHVSDEDYDDLTATIRIDRSEEHALDVPQELRFVAAHLDYSRRILPNMNDHRELGIVGPGEKSSADASENELLVASNGGYLFAVAPGADLVVEVSSRAQVPMIFAVVEEETGRVRWKCEHLQPRVKNMGICAIENRTTRAQQFRLVCLHHPTDTQSLDSWQASRHKVLFEQRGFVNIGFDDGRTDASLAKVNVSLITMGSL